MANIFVRAHPSTWPKSRGEGGTVALWDVSPEHASDVDEETEEGQIWIDGNSKDKVFEVAETPRVLDAIKNNRLQRLGDSEGRELLASQGETATPQTDAEREREQSDNQLAAALTAANPNAPESDQEDATGDEGDETPDTPAGATALSTDTPNASASTPRRTTRG